MLHIAVLAVLFVGITRRDQQIDHSEEKSQLKLRFCNSTEITELTLRDSPL